MEGTKPGYKTTEFYLTLLTNVIAIIGALKGVIPDNVATIIVATANAAYGLIRALTKATATPSTVGDTNVTVKAS